MFDSPRTATSLLAAALCVSLLAPLLACADRTVAEVGEPDDDPDPGEQPLAMGAMYSPCVASADCPGSLCVFPSGEAGYCSQPCAAPTDASRCEPAPGDQSTTCFDIGLPDGSWVCALDCADIACPTGMRCEQVSAGDGPRSICF